MSDYDFIVDNIVFSYSSTSTFENCPHSFKLTYLDALPRENNFFAEYGTLIHECMEKYFSGEVDMFTLSQYYREHYNSVVKTSAPPSPPDLGEKYKAQGQEFFDNFSFEKENYNILLNEDKIEFELDGIRLIAKPDLILENKETGIKTLYDYKTAVPFREDKKTGKIITDKKKIKGFYKQMYMYTHALRLHKNISVDQITLWFTRAFKEVTIPWVLQEEEEAIDWLQNTIEKIKKEEIFPYNNTNPYFCDNLCSVRAYCEYR